MHWEKGQMSTCLPPRGSVLPMCTYSSNKTQPLDDMSPVAVWYVSKKIRMRHSLVVLRCLLFFVNQQRYPATSPQLKHHGVENRAICTHRARPWEPAISFSFNLREFAYASSASTALTITPDFPGPSTSQNTWPMRGVDVVRLYANCAHFTQPCSSPPIKPLVQASFSRGESRLLSIIVNCKKTEPETIARDIEANMRTDSRPLTALSLLSVSATLPCWDCLKSRWTKTQLNPGPLVRGENATAAHDPCTLRQFYQHMVPYAPHQKKRDAAIHYQLSFVNTGIDLTVVDKKS